MQRVRPHIGSILSLSGRYDFDPYLVAAFCEVESGFNTYAIRYEPHYRWLVGENLSPTEEISQKTSWGLMQVMGAVARERGLRSKYLSALTEPKIGIRFGCAHLAWFRDKKGYSGDDMIAAYNAGSPRKKNGIYVNQGYVDKVNRCFQEMKNTALFDPHVQI